MVLRGTSYVYVSVRLNGNRLDIQHPPRARFGSVRAVAGGVVTGGTVCVGCEVSGQSLAVSAVCWLARMAIVSRRVSRPGQPRIPEEGKVLLQS